MGGDGCRLAGRLVAALAVASLMAVLVIVPVAFARRHRPPRLTWRMLSPVALGPGPRYFKPSPGPTTRWSSTGSAPVLAVGRHGGLAAWAGPHAEVLAALGAQRGGGWQSLSQPNAGVAPLPERPELVAALDPQGDALVGWQSQ